MNGPTAVIAEDEPLLAQALQRMLAAAWPQLSVVNVAHDGESALDAIRTLAPDVAFLDIRMPGLTGLQVAERLMPGEVPRGGIVFVTAYDQYAVEAFETEAVDYLLKPVVPQRLARCIERLRARLAASSPAPVAEELRRLLARLDEQLGAPGGAQSDTQVGMHSGTLPGTQSDASTVAPIRFIRASLGDVIRQIPVSEVLYFEAQDKYVSVVTRESTALVRIALTDLLAGLDPARFAQIHRSTIVNLEAIDTIRRDFAGRTFVHLRETVGGREVKLAVSRAYSGQFKGM